MHFEITQKTHAESLPVDLFLCNMNILLIYSSTSSLAPSCHFCIHFSTKSACIRRPYTANANKQHQRRSKEKRWIGTKKRTNHLLVTSTILSINGVKIRWIRLLCVKWWNACLSKLIYCRLKMYSYWW